MLTTSLLLLCAGPTRASRQGGFPAIDEALDDGGRRDAAALVLPVRFRYAVQSSPTPSAIDTAQAMGVTPLPQPALRDIDHGRWAGHDFATIATEEPEALAQWLADPAQALEAIVALSLAAIYGATRGVRPAGRSRTGAGR